MWYFSWPRCETCQNTIVGARCHNCHPPASTQPPTTGPKPEPEPDPDDWSTMWAATRNALRLAETDTERQDAWRRSMINSCSSSK